VATFRKAGGKRPWTSGAQTSGSASEIVAESWTNWIFDVAQARSDRSAMPAWPGPATERQPSPQ